MTDISISEKFYKQCMGTQLIIADNNGNVHRMLLARWASRHSVGGHVHLLKKIFLFFTYVAL